MAIAVNELSATRIYLTRRQLVEILISLEDIEKRLRQEAGDEFFEANEHLLEKIYHQAK